MFSFFVRVGGVGGLSLVASSCGGARDLGYRTNFSAQTEDSGLFVSCAHSNIDPDAMTRMEGHNKIKKKLCGKLDLVMSTLSFGKY